MAQMYYYNDVKLPALPEPDPTKISALCTKDDIPYCMIFDQSESKPDYPYVVCWGVGEWHHETAENYNYCNDQYAIYCAYDGNTWCDQHGLMTGGGTYLVGKPIWANRDVTTWNGTEFVLYLPASDPVPVGGEPEQPETDLTARDLYRKINGKPTKLPLYKKLGGKLIPLDEYTKEVKT